ncbi:MAG: tetratricopeptide repeat protein [Tannerella sp.]|jgi:TolA-binding protein|nr:tetratricopeptide repeat protein [Tannerella sp.]
MRTVTKIIVMAGLFLSFADAQAQRSHPIDARERLFSEGKDFFLLKNYAGATDKLEAFKKAELQTSLDSKYKDLIQEADYMLAFIAFNEGKDYATEQLEEFLKTYPDSQHGDEACLLIGKGWFERAEYQNAEKWLADIRKDALSDGQQDELNYRLGYSQMKNGKLEEARESFGKVGEYGVEYTQAAIYYIAYIDYATGKYDDALKEFNRLKRTPEYREKSDYYIAQINYLKDNYDEVVKLADRLLRTYPKSENNNELYRIAGNSYYYLGNQEKTVEMLKKYVAGTDKPGRGELYIMGICDYYLGKYNDAVEALTKTVTDDDETGQNASMFLGQSYLQLGDKNKARMAFETASALTFNKKIQESALYNYALLVHETSFTGFGESVKVFEQFLNDYPNSQYSDKVNDYLAEVYLTSKNYQSALESINKIRQPSTKILEAKQNVLFQLGNQEFTNNKMEAAIEYFTKTIEMGNYDPEASANAYFWRGESYYRLENYQNAITDFNIFRNLSRQNSSDTYSLVYYNLGYCYFKRHDFQQSLVSFRRYVTLETNEDSKSLADSYNRIGDCLFYNRQFAEAETNYTRAATLQPSSADYAVYQKGFVLGLQKDYTGKIRQMDRIVSDFPESQYLDDALYERGRTYVLLDKPQEAAQSFNSLISRYPNSTLAPKAGVQLGLLYYNDNQLENSVSAYKKVISDYPGSEEAKVAVQDLKSVYIDLNDVSSYAQYVNSLGGAMQIEVSEQDSLTFLAAEKLFTRGDFSGAQRSLVSYLNTFKGGAFSSNANYYLAKIAFDEKNYKEAKRLFSIVLESGDTKFREESLARKSEIEYMDKDYAPALQSFKDLRLVAETRENRLAALLGIMRCGQFTGNETESLEASGDLLKEPNLSPEIEMEARYLRAKYYLKLGQSDKALGDLTALSKDTRTEYGAEAKYRLAQYYYDKKDVTRAEKEMLNFIENGTNHQYWLARGFILLADIYIDKGDDFQARQYLTSLKRNYGGKSEDVDRMIEQRLEKIKTK